MKLIRAILQWFRQEPPVPELDYEQIEKYSRFWGSQIVMCQTETQTRINEGDWAGARRW